MLHVTMVRVPVILLSSLCAFAVTTAPVAASPGETPSRDSALRQVAGILDYIGSDYAVAVDAQGNVKNELEYEEQLKLTDDARKLAENAGLPDDDPVVRGLHELRAQIENKPAPSTILEACKALRRTLVDTHDVVLEPREPPRPTLGEQLYVQQGCATCHGAEGGAETPQARVLEPPPADFLDRDRVAGVSPHRAFYAITHGVDGTAMQGYGHLSDHERWSLAFWVLSLRHRDASEDTLRRGRRALSQAGWPIDPSPQHLAHLRPDDIREKLEGRLESPEQRRAALAWLRARAPFERTSARAAKGGEAEHDRDRFAIAHTQLQKGVEAYRRGDHEAAHGHFVSAYLDGFEPREAAVGARDPQLVRRIEKAMLELRSAASGGAPAEQIASKAQSIEGMLDRAGGDASGSDSLGKGATFTGSALIALREGFEAVLLVIALLALVRSRGEERNRKWVHAGWLVALPAGLITWLAVGELLGGLQREVAEGIVALVAAAVLLGVTHWFLGEVGMRRGMGLLARQIGRLKGRWAAGGVFALAFIAVYREAVEVVLFYKALVLDAPAHVHLVWMGGVAGLGGLAIVALVLQKLGRKLKPRPFMLASSVLLAVLTLILVGKGVHSLQEAGWIAASSLPLPDLPALGVYATVQGLITQGALLLALALSAVTAFRPPRKRQQRTSSAPG